MGSKYDHSALSDLALSLAREKPCPMCDAVDTWRAVADPVNVGFADHVFPKEAVGLGCTRCGYLTLFISAQLNEYAAELKANGH